MGKNKKGGGNKGKNVGAGFSIQEPPAYVKETKQSKARQEDPPKATTSVPVVKGKPERGTASNKPVEKTHKPTSDKPQSSSSKQRNEESHKKVEGVQSSDSNHCSRADLKQPNSQDVRNKDRKERSASRNSWTDYTEVRKKNHRSRSRGSDDTSGSYKNQSRMTDYYPSLNQVADEDDYKAFSKFCKSCTAFKKVSEVDCDLFALPKEYSLAHCVAEDMAMGSGIAVNFRRDFKNVDQLYAQRQKQGGLAVLEHDNRFIYYLVTKRVSTGKPTLLTLLKSLRKLQQHVEKNKVKALGMPRIGCGLDRLEWTDVKPMLEFVFENTDVTITVCNFQQFEDSQPKLRRCFVANITHPLTEADIWTVIIYLGSEDGYVTEAMKKLECRFEFCYDYKRSCRSVGCNVVKSCFDDKYILCGFIVKKHAKDEFDFVNFQKCVTALRKWNLKLPIMYESFGIDAFLDEDDLIMSKIASLLSYGLAGKEKGNVYVSWTGECIGYMPPIPRKNSF